LVVAKSLVETRSSAMTKTSQVVLETLVMKSSAMMQKSMETRRCVVKDNFTMME
jgi:hypothetical protein